MKCPVCRATYRANPTISCRRCGADLAALIQLHDQAIGHHRQAIAHFAAGNLATAIAMNAQAIALHSQQAQFHAFAGQLFALQGDLGQALRSWQLAKTLDPQVPMASDCLMTYTLMLAEIDSQAAMET
jgi:tetratricopeptide (TPR) repeat protein